MALAFETAHGMPPASGFTKMPFASIALGAEQTRRGSAGIVLATAEDPWTVIMRPTGIAVSGS